MSFLYRDEWFGTEEGATAEKGDEGTSDSS